MSAPEHKARLRQDGKSGALLPTATQLDDFWDALGTPPVFRRCAKIFACRLDGLPTLKSQQEVEQTCELSSSWSALNAKQGTTRQQKNENRAEPKSDLSCASIASTVANTLFTERPDNAFVRCEFRVAG